MKPVIVNQVSKVFRHSMKVWELVKAVDEISFSMEQGEIVGFVGHNGAGKTTTIKMLMGFISATSGSIEVFGQHPKSVEIKKKIGFLPERPYFYTQLTAKEMLSYFGQLAGLERKYLPDLTKTVLRRVGLEQDANTKLAAFSKGMLQRAGIAQAIIHNPEFVIMDEPMSGLDPAGRRDVKNLIRDLKKEGKTVLFSSHILSDIENLSDRVLIIEKGHITSFGRLQEIVPEKDIRWHIVFDTTAKDRDSVFSTFRTAKIENDSFVIYSVSENEMNDQIKAILEKGYHLKEAGPIYPTLEEIVFKTGETRGGQS